MHFITISTLSSGNLEMKIRVFECAKNKSHHTTHHIEMSEKKHQSKGKITTHSQ